MLLYQRFKNTELPAIHKACIAVLILVLIYDYNSMETPVVVRIKEPSFTLLGPQNYTESSVTDEPNQLIDITDFKFTINPRTCDNITSFLLLIIVSSNPKNVQNRMAIRQTWGRPDDSTKLVFLLGRTTEALQNQLRNESATYGDIVQGSFLDAYRNMTYKHVMGLKWVNSYCGAAKYILKTDDDLVLHPDKLRHFLAKELSPWGTKDLILCPRLQHSQVDRENWSKWKVEPEEYKDKYYPTYCAGYVILYSQNVVPRLLEVAQETPYFWIDDVQITGVVAEKIGVPRTPLTTLILNQARSKLLRMSGPAYVGQYLFGPQDMSVENMLKLWTAMVSDTYID